MTERFWAKVRRGDGCWEWQAAIRSGSGYGVFQLGVGKQAPAHRVAWTLTRGEIPEGLWVLHHCDNRRCVNPDHLYLGTAKDNCRDREVRRRGKNSRKTHCPQGHPLEDPTLHKDRHCKTCEAQRARRKRAMQRVTADGAVFAFGDAKYLGRVRAPTS